MSIRLLLLVISFVVRPLHRSRLIVDAKLELFWDIDQDCVERPNPLRTNISIAQRCHGVWVTRRINGGLVPILSNRTTLLVAVTSFLSCTVCSAANRTTSPDRTSSSIPIAFVDVNVISMNRDEVLEHQGEILRRLLSRALLWALGNDDNHDH